MRLTQSLFPQGVLALHCFVDDPIATIKGTTEERQLTVATIVVTWEALNFQLAYKKGQFGAQAVWIGGQLTVTDQGIRAEVKQAIVDDIKSDIVKFLSTNLVSRDDLRTFVGRCNHAAGLLIVLRPFLHSLWAALSSPNTGPPNTVWTRQIAHTLQWLKAFFIDSSTPGIVRKFTLDEFQCTGDRIEIGTDASPWGLGGWYSINGHIKYYYHSPVSDHDLQIYGITRGSCEGQQVLEGLAILVALRIWEQQLSARRLALIVRGDNVGALSLLVKMRPSSPQQAIVARELALVTVHAAFPPDVEHTPGLAHRVADGLSRIDDPAHQGRGILDHPALAAATATDAPVRDRQWYRALPAQPPLQEQ